VLVAALSTGHKLGLALVAAVFIGFALVSSFLLPRRRPDFPGERGLRWFIVATITLFVAMLLAVEFFAKESESAGAEPGKAAGAGPAPAAAKTVKVSEKEFKITLTQATLAPGAYEFDVSNDGKIQHDLTIDGPGVAGQKTPLIDAGKQATLKVALKSGTYDFYCSVPGHKAAGMDLKVTVS
jgi:plastocyanin